MAVVLGGLAVMAPVIVTTVFGPAFEPAVTPMRIILAALLLAALNPPLVSMLQGEGKAAEVARVMSVAAVAGLLAVLVGAQWGASGASWSVLIVQAIVLGQLLHLVRAPSPAGATVLEPAR